MRYNSFNDVLDSSDLIDFELPEERDFDAPSRDYDYDEDDTDYEPNYDLGEPSELTEWMDYDPDC